MAKIPVRRKVLSKARQGIEQAILFVRGHRVLLDADLATMYGVQTKVLIQSVKRNMARFPGDFMFQLVPDEIETLRSQIVTSKSRGGRRYRPYAFTEQGVAMLSSTLRSGRAIEVNIEIMRAFVRMRQILSHNDELRHRLDQVERKLEDQDGRFGIIFDAIRQLMNDEIEETPKTRIGFDTEQKRP